MAMRTPQSLIPTCLKTEHALNLETTLTGSVASHRTSVSSEAKLFTLRGHFMLTESSTTFFTDSNRARGVQGRSRSAAQSMRTGQNLAYAVHTAEIGACHGQYPAHVHEKAEHVREHI